MIISSIFWNVSPEIIKLGPFSLRWYGLLFALAFVFGYIILTKVYKLEKKSQADLEQLSIYVILGTVIGARLGHCLFYDPVYYLSHPIEIIKVWEGGLASHGAAIGILISIYLISKKQKDKSMLWILDRLVIVVALGGALIRLGNLFNSEIIGKAADVPWAFIFARIDNIPRHPTQLYESFFYLITFAVLYFTYMKTQKLADPDRRYPGHPRLPFPAHGTIVGASGMLAHRRAGDGKRVGLLSERFRQRAEAGRHGGEGGEGLKLRDDEREGTQQLGERHG